MVEIDTTIGISPQKINSQDWNKLRILVLIETQPSSINDLLLPALAHLKYLSFHRAWQGVWGGRRRALTW